MIGPRHIAISLLLASACPSQAQVQDEVHENLPKATTMIRGDTVGDESKRRVDTLGTPLPDVPGQVLPDLVDLRLSAWEPDYGSPHFPFAGIVPEADGSYDFLRVRLELKGLINPPGTLGLNGLPWSPLEFGQSPIYGWLELDVDDDQNTGGEIGLNAEFRYMVNCARFGGLPDNPRGGRAVQWGYEIDGDFFTPPFYERSGADWALAMCGCHATVKVTEFIGDNDNTFETGEDWVVEGRFFVRAGGYRDGSSVFGGSGVGLYDPITSLRFEHVEGPDALSEDDDRTVVTLVYPLTMNGASLLTGEANQSVNFNVSDHNSVEEGLNDLIVGANSGALAGANLVLQNAWAGRLPDDYLDPGQWHATAMVATAYPSPGSELYLWTDCGFDATFGDLDRDGDADAIDRQIIIDFIAASDGPTSGLDADATVNGSVEIVLFAANFIVADFDYDGDIDQDDVDNPVYPVPVVCEGDADANGVVDVADVSYVIFRLGNSGGGNVEGDADGNGVVDVADLSYVIFRLGTICP